VSAPARRPLLFVLVGPTAAGKSDVAHEAARRLGGEIISADAFAVYRGMDVGTAKPSPEQRGEVPYHLVDVAEPEETYTAGRWAQEARAAIEDIATRGRVPIVCGGSGFYVSALLDGLPSGAASDATVRRTLAGWASRHGPSAAHRFLELNDPVSAQRIAPGNPRYVLRALEILLISGSPASARRREPGRWADGFRVEKLDLRPERSDLGVRIEARVRRMLDAGWDEEVRRLLDRGLSVESNSFLAIGYREVAEWVLGRISKQEAEQQIVKATRRFAKRQATWFGRDREARRVKPEEALDVILALVGETGEGETR
jgi:tRNA dimethylallyltransferase